MIRPDINVSFMLSLPMVWNKSMAIQSTNRRHHGLSSKQGTKEKLLELMIPPQIGWVVQWLARPS
jgi:hypothetical protein